MFINRREGPVIYYVRSQQDFGVDYGTGRKGIELRKDTEG